MLLVGVVAGFVYVRVAYAVSSGNWGGHVAYIDHARI